MKNKFLNLIKNKEFILFLILIAVFIFMAVLSPENFLSKYNLQSMASQFPELGILSIAMMVVIISGGIDLSIIGIATLSGVSGVYIINKLGPSVVTGITGLERETGTGIISGAYITILAILTIIVVAMICGLFNGFFISKLGVSPILVTLGTMILFEGISLYFTKGGSLAGLPDQYLWIASGKIIGIPVLLIIFSIIALAVGITLEKSQWGRCVYMFGSNPIATKFSGINTKKIVFSVYIFSALLSAIAAILMTARYNSAKVGAGSSYLLQSITIAVLGGTAITGGTGKIIGVVIAVAIVQVLKTGFNILEFSPWTTDIVSGAILIIVLMIDLYLEKTKIVKT